MASRRNSHTQSLLQHPSKTHRIRLDINENPMIHESSPLVTNDTSPEDDEEVVAHGLMSPTASVAPFSEENILPVAKKQSSIFCCLREQDLSESDEKRIIVVLQAASCIGMIGILLVIALIVIALNRT